MKLAILRFVRILLGQVISWSLAYYGNVNIPILEISIGALINGLFKYIRDKYPKSVILEYLPL